MTSDTLGTVLIVGAFATTVSMSFYRHRVALVLTVSLLASVMLALAGIVFDSTFVKILGAYGIIMDVRSITRYADAKENAR